MVFKYLKRTAKEKYKDSKTEFLQKQAANRMIKKQKQAANRIIKKKATAEFLRTKEKEALRFARTKAKVNAARKMKALKSSGGSFFGRFSKVTKTNTTPTTKKSSGGSFFSGFSQVTKTNTTPTTKRKTTKRRRETPRKRKSSVADELTRMI